MTDVCAVTASGAPSRRPQAASVGARADGAPSGETAPATAEASRVPIRPRDLPGLVGIPLSEEQLAAATAPLAPQLIVAGAGTGKTTVMAARVVWLIASGQVSSDEVLGLTFTNKAAAELSHRIRRAARRLPADGQTDGEATVLTYHAFAGRLVTQYGLLLGVESDSRLVADGQRARLAHEIACEPLDPTGLSGSPKALAEQIRAMDDTLADLAIGVEDLQACDSELLALLRQARGPASLVAQMVAAAEQRLRVATLVAQFREAKQAGEWLDFADQMRLGSAIAAEVPLAGEQLRSRFRVVLLDEYQDTSRAQRRTLQSLFAHGHAVTAVGDPCQAIYGWRGASVTNIDEFPRHFPDRDGTPARVDELTVNRRSRPVILAAANRMSDPLRAFHTVARPLRARPDDDGGDIRCALLRTWDEELLWLGGQLAELGATRSWTEIAVLCRSNDQVAAVVDHLRNVGVPAHVSSRRDLLALPEVASVVALLRVLADPFANPDLVHHLIGPRWRIGPRDLAILGRRARDLGPAEPDQSRDAPVSLLDAVHEPGGREYGYSDAARNRLATFAAELDELEAMRNHPVADIVAACVETIAAAVVPVDETALPESLGRFTALAQSFRGLDGGRGLADFVGYLDDCVRFEGSPADEEQTTGDGVAVMTVHAAKGLEFGVVALPFLSDGVFPERRGRARWVTSPHAVPPVPLDEPDPARTLGFPGVRFTTKDHDAYVAACRFDDRLDEDRLAYVAVTRAKEMLIASGHWWGATQARPRGPSAYLSAIREVAEESGGAVGPWITAAGERPDRATGGATASPVWPAPVEQDRVVRLAQQLAVPAEANGPDALPPDTGADAGLPAADTGGHSDEPPGDEDGGKVLPDGGAAATVSTAPRSSGAAGFGDTSRASSRWQEVGGTPAGGAAISPRAAEGSGNASEVSNRWQEVGGTPAGGAAISPRAAEGSGNASEVSNRWQEVVDRVIADRLQGGTGRLTQPPVVSVSSVMSWLRAPEEFRAEQRRPLPRRPTAAAAKGTAFHSWMEHRAGQQVLFELPEEQRTGGAERFEEMLAGTRFADRTPAAVEQPFVLAVGELVITGRIDAVFAVPDDERFDWEVVDWKTGDPRKADPAQLALYRTAWSQLTGCLPERVRASFVFLGDGSEETYVDLVDAAQVVARLPREVWAE